MSLSRDKNIFMPASINSIAIPYCYIANAKTKRDWLIRGHVALDKCNVSPRETSKKLLPGCEYKKNKMAA